MPEDIHPIVSIWVVLFSLASGLFSLYCTYIAFVGGTIPLLGWELDGGAVSGVLWLVFVTPLVSMVAYWIAMLVTLPLIAIFKKRS